MDQEVQLSCPQFWKIQLALKCDNHKTMGCPANLKQGGKRGKKERKNNAVKQYMNIVITIRCMPTTKYKQGEPWAYSEFQFGFFHLADGWGRFCRGEEEQRECLLS